MTTKSMSRSRTMFPAQLHAALVERYGLSYLLEDVIFAIAIATYFNRNNNNKWSDRENTRNEETDLALEREFLQIAATYATRIESLNYSTKIDRDYLKKLEDKDIIFYSGGHFSFSLRRSFFMRCDELLARHCKSNAFAVEGVQSAAVEDGSEPKGLVISRDAFGLSEEADKDFDFNAVLAEAKRFADGA